MSINYDEWHSGPPPSVGWWPTSVHDVTTLYRWWDGKRWSLPVGRYAGAYMAGRFASAKSLYSSGPGGILWRHRPPSWPKRSRT